MNNNSTVFCASCNEPGHSRRTSRLCRLNPRNQVDNDVQMEDAQQQQSSVNTVYCSACNEPGHSRRTFARCRLNPRNMSLELDEETPSREICSSCGNEGHSRRTSRLCPLNAQFTRNIARDLSAVPSGRHELGSMSCVCSHCGALMWAQERISNSSITQPVFQLCCCKGDVMLSSLQPTPPEIGDLLKGVSRQHQNVQ